MGLVGRGADRFEEVNPLNAELNPICHLLALLGGATIVVVSRLRVNGSVHGSVFVLSPDSPESQQLQRDKKTIGSETQFGLLMIGVKTPETC